MGPKMTKSKYIPPKGDKSNFEILILKIFIYNSIQK